MSIVDTRSFFEALPNRAQQVSELVQVVFPNMSPAAIAYELTQQGLLQQREAQRVFDYWTVVHALDTALQALWCGPDVATYILPVQQGALKNGVSYARGICLFVSPLLSVQELRALFAHEYCHSCHRQFLSEPLTLADSLIAEGLAEYAVESLYGTSALSAWTTRYSLQEVQSYWPKIQSQLDVAHLRNHRIYLLGGGELPRWIGYCTGYRIMQAFLAREGEHSVQQLLQIKPRDIISRAGFDA